MDITRRRVSLIKNYFVILLVLLIAIFIFTPRSTGFAQEQSQKSEASIMFKKVHQPDSNQGDRDKAEVKPSKVDPVIPDGPIKVGSTDSGVKKDKDLLDKGFKLPKTATNAFNLSLLAILIIVLGSILYYQTRREKQEIDL